MKSISLSTRLYLSAVSVAGVVVLFSRSGDMQFEEPWLLAVLCGLASLALILRVEGSNSRSYYTFGFMVYGFTFAAFGVGNAILVIFLSQMVEWTWYRSSWSIQFFEMSTCILAVEAAGLVYYWIHQSTALISGEDILAILLGMAVFTLLNHMMRGFLYWLTRRLNFKKRSVLDFFPLVLDVSLLYFGASLAIVWRYNPFALVLFVVPTYLLYRALRIPALERKTELDSKTGLFNHAYFKKQLDGELSRSKRFNRPLSVIIADLDLLRNINNTYGHLAGDEVLIGVATAMKQSVREYDIVSRFGGEEFAILLPETTLEQAYEKAEFFRKTIEGMEFIVPTSKTPIRATMSFGVAHRESLDQTSNEIVHNADLAVYHSKLSGRNRTFAHSNKACLAFPGVRLEPTIASSGIEIDPPVAYLLGSYMQPPFN